MGRERLTIGTFGHAGDGNLHPTVIYDGPDGEAQARKAFDAILAGTLALGGSITGEHGVGQLKQHWLELMVGSRERALMVGIKAAFDPNGILNPGRGF